MPSRLNYDEETFAGSVVDVIIVIQGIATNTNSYVVIGQTCDAKTSNWFDYDIASCRFAVQQSCLLIRCWVKRIWPLNGRPKRLMNEKMVSPGLRYAAP